ncbi:MAG TPA: type II secretion system F family protein [Sphingomicrobium sp.]|nr:type II secretion system F family protein [Sphingomicrobium sp.]
MNDSWIKAIVLVCVFGAVLLLVETLVRAFGESREHGKAINLRMKLIGEGRTRSEALTLLRRARSDFESQAPSAFQPLARKFDRLVTSARLSMSASRLMLLIALAPALVFLVLIVLILVSHGAITFGRLVLLLTFSIAVGAGLPLMVLRIKASRMRRRMEEQFPVALDVFVRGLRAGHPVAAALDLLTVEMPDPIGTEFGTVTDEVTYGAELRDALADMAERWDMEDIRMFVVSLAIQNETGGNLAEILENLSRVIRERAAMMMKVRALSSEGRMTAIMLTGLPVFAFTLLFIISPSFYLDVADDRAFVPGFVFLLILYAIGFITIRRMVDLKV